jgi:hypothetical protein
MPDLRIDEVAKELIAAVTEGRLFPGREAVACASGSYSVHVLFPNGQRIVLIHMDSCVRANVAAEIMERVQEATQVL